MDFILILYKPQMCLYLYCLFLGMVTEIHHRRIWGCFYFTIMYNFDFSLEGEIWKAIKNYEEKYVISNKGRVVALDYKRTNEPKLRKAAINQKGYMNIRLSDGVNTEQYRIHRLVANAFIGTSDLDIDHLNGIKTDNRVENLEYVTCRENNSRRCSQKERSSKFIGVQKIVGATGIKWRASISINKKRITLGQFFTETEASKMYDAALIIHNSGGIVSKENVEWFVQQLKNNPIS